MQKNNKKASILIWWIILSLTLSFIFISISSKINLNLKQNSDIKKEIEEKQKIENNLVEIEKIFKEIKNENFYEKILKTEKENILKKFEEITKKENNEIKSIENNKTLTKKEESKEIEKIKENYKKFYEEEYDKLYEKIDYNNYLGKIKKIERYTKINNDISIKIKKEEIYNLQNTEEIEFIIPPTTNVNVEILAWEIKFKEDEKAEKNLDKMQTFQSDYFFKKIILKNTWWYSKISIIWENYIISKKKNFEIYENFWDKKLFRKSGTLQIN